MSYFTKLHVYQFILQKRIFKICINSVNIALVIITQTFWLLLHQVWGLTSFRRNSSNPSGRFLRWSIYWDLWFQQEIFSYPELKLNRNSLSIFSTHSYFFKVFNHHYYSIYMYSSILEFNVQSDYMNFYSII